MKNTFHSIKAVASVVILLGVVYTTGNLYIHGTVTSPADVEHIAVLTEEELNPKPKEPEKPFDLATFVADAIKGEKISGKCKACHQFKNNGKNGVGPNLWNVYGRQIAAIENYKYSDAFNERKGNLEWSQDELYAYLKDPKAHIPGTKMAFAGLKREADRLNLIEYLKTLK